MPVDLIATSTMGLEAVVSRELTHLGYENRIVGLGRVGFSADEIAICHANLWLRSAGRVLLKVGAFNATDFGQTVRPDLRASVGPLDSTQWGLPR